MAYGFSTAMLAGMTCDGLVTVVVDTVRVGDPYDQGAAAPDHGAGRHEG
jgi:hypothetical protein